MLVEWETSTPYPFFFSPGERQRFFCSLINNATDDINVVVAEFGHTVWRIWRQIHNA